MRQSKLFTKTRKEAPKDEESKNAKLLIRGGFIHKEMAGVYSYLPLGLRVLNKIEGIIREEMNSLGGQEVWMPALHPKENWLKTGRWETFDVLYRLQDARGREYALGPSHEEIVVPMVQEYADSYKDFPLAVYQFQDKFRAELRAKSGLFRGREFLMKDMYSFHVDLEDFEEFYGNVKNAYINLFKRVGIGELTHPTFASGGAFSKFSEEFQTLSEAGEDLVYFCEGCDFAVNQEIIDDTEAQEEKGYCKEGAREEKSIEVGNIFALKTKFTEPFNYTVRDEENNEQEVYMGCYGIGLGRLMGTVVEVLSDESGMIWPESIAPFQVHLLSLGEEKEAEKIYEELTSRGIEVLFDDRDASAGQKFADADLIGLPYRVVVSAKTVEAGMLEVKRRTEEKPEIISLEDLIARF